MLRVLLLFALILTSVRGDGKKTEAESTNLRLNSTQVVKYNETTKVEKGCRGPGTPVEFGKYPYFVIIYPKSECSSDFCSGSIIHENWILTSAHCLFGRLYARAYGGVIDIKKLDEAEYMSGDIPSKHFVIHPAYTYRSVRNNIALMYVCESIRHTRHVTITNLPLRSDELDNGLPANIPGFGTMRHNGDPPTILREVTYQIEKGGLCDETFEEGKYSPEQHLCLKPGVEGSACVSDIGGGLALIRNGREAIHGIFDYYSEDGCDKNLPNVYTRVTSFLSWIYTVTGIPDMEKLHEIDTELNNTLKEEGSENVIEEYVIETQLETTESKTRGDKDLEEQNKKKTNLLIDKLTETKFEKEETTTDIDEPTLSDAETSSDESNESAESSEEFEVKEREEIEYEEYSYEESESVEEKKTKKPPKKKKRKVRKVRKGTKKIVVTSKPRVVKKEKKKRHQEKAAAEEN